jgi:hypothetical protein
MRIFQEPIVKGECNVSINTNQFKICKKNPSVVCTELDDGAVLLNLDTKYYFNLNETGLRIWQALEESQNLLEIAERLASEYEVEVGRAKASVVKLMEDFEKNGLIVSDVKGD